MAVSEEIYCGEQGKTGQKQDFEGGRLPELRKKGEMVGKGFRCDQSQKIGEISKKKEEENLDQRRIKPAVRRLQQP